MHVKSFIDIIEASERKRERKMKSNEFPYTQMQKQMSWI